LITVCYELIDKPEATPAIKEALRNVGTFFGLITIVRDKPINADSINFRPLLEDAIKSNNEAKLQLTVVLVTHVFKHCQRSVIFKKDCTWVSAIIEVIKELHEDPKIKLNTKFEIERFLEGLEEKEPEDEQETFFDDRGFEQNPYQFMNDYDEQMMPPQMHQNYYVMPQQQQASSRINFQMEQPAQMRHVHQPSQHPMMNMNQGSIPTTPNRFYAPMNPQRTPQELQQRHLAQQQQMFMQAQPAVQLPSLQHRNDSPPRMSHYQQLSMMNNMRQAQQRTPQRQFANATPQRILHQNVQQPAAFNYPAKELYRPQEDPILASMINRLDFLSSPIFKIFTTARECVVRTFPIIMEDIQKSFMDRMKPLLASICESFLLRDMAFCNDEKQLRVTYHQAIRAYVVALLQPRCNVGHVRTTLQQLMKRLFAEIVQKDASSLYEKQAREDDHFIVQCVDFFLEKNSEIITDYFCTLLDRHSEEWADQVATRCLNERNTVMLGHQNMELKRFVNSPRNIHDVNMTLPLQLHRSYGNLDEADFGVYVQYDELSENLHQYMEKYGFNDLKTLEDPTEEEQDQCQDEQKVENEVVETESVTSEDLKPDDSLLSFIENLYKKNPSDNPEFFFEYTRLIMQQRFLDRLNAEFSPKHARGYLILLILPIVRLVSMFNEREKLKNASEKFASSLVHMFATLTRECPEAFDSYYMAFSEAMPDVMLHLRNMIMNCKPKDVFFLPFTEFNEICMSAQMNTDLNIDVEQLCKMPPRLKEIINSQMVGERHTGFPEEVISEFKSTKSDDKGESIVYNRALMLHTIVYIAHVSIKNIHDRNLTIDPKNLSSNSGQAMLANLISSMDSQGRYIAFSLMVDQLRYPSSMTSYFACLILNLFMSTNTVEIRETLCRVLIERFLPQPPYPWGLRLVMWELLRDPMLKFKSYQYLQGSVEIDSLIKRIEAICQNQ